MGSTAKKIVFWNLLLLALPLWAQNPVMRTISSKWSDSFAAWDIYAAFPDESQEEAEDVSEDFYGEMSQRWLNVRDDWSEWDFEVGGIQGSIRQKWKDDPQQWELRSYNNIIVTMRTAWNGDFDEWKVTDNDITLQLRSKWSNQLDEWLVKDEQYGSLYLYTLNQNDPRDWAIEDNLSPEVSEEMKLALIFLVIYNAVR